MAVNSTDALPDQPVDPRTIAVWRWTTALPFIPILTVGSFATVAATVAGAPATIPFWIALLLLCTIVATVVWRYPPARYRHLRYNLDEVAITIQDGVFWRTQSALPRVRIQHTDVSQGPLQRRYGVATLKLYTAGSRFTRTDLPGLEHAVAVALRDRLQRQISGDAV